MEKSQQKIVGDLYDRLFPKVFAYVAFRIGREQDAEDLVAETFLRAAQGIAGFKRRQAGSLDAWLFRIAHNLVINYYRLHSWKSPIPLEDLANIEGDAVSPDEAALRRERFTHLRQLIGGLAPRQQEVITLKFFGELRNLEIAKVLRIHEKTVAAYLCRALDQMREAYASGAEEQPEPLGKEQAT